MALTTTVLKSDALGRVTISKEHREALLDAFDQSGLKELGFARHHGGNYNFYRNRCCCFDQMILTSPYGYGLVVISGQER